MSKFKIGREQRHPVRFLPEEVAVQLVRLNDVKLEIFLPPVNKAMSANERTVIRKFPYYLHFLRLASITPIRFASSAVVHRHLRILIPPLFESCNHLSTYACLYYSEAMNILRRDRSTSLRICGSAVTTVTAGLTIETKFAIDMPHCAHRTRHLATTYVRDCTSSPLH